MKRIFATFAVAAALFAFGGVGSAQDAFPKLVLKVKSWYPLPGGKVVKVTLESGATIELPFDDIDLPTQKQMAEAWAWGQQGGKVQQQAVSGPTLDTSIIRPKCAKEWPSDFEMRAYCEKQQNEAVTRLRFRPMSTADHQTIRNKCATEWPDDFEMRNYCEEQQLKALAIIK
jgi:hypothetical protein